MELYFLGTGAGLPARHRNVSALALILKEYQNDIWLFDCGEGTQQQILDSPIRLSQLSQIFITHLHGDHLFGLPGILGTRSFQGTTTPLQLYGPKGLRSFVESAMNVSQTHIRYPLFITEFTEPMQISLESFHIIVGQLAHGIPSFGYRIVEKETPGRLQAERLMAEGIPPGPLFQQLKQGKKVLTSDGRTLNGKDYLDPPRPGRVVTILGDTRPNETSIQLAQNADLLVHEATFDHNEVIKAEQAFHSTTQQAAEIAKQANVQKLVLTHLSSRYSLDENDRLQQEARVIFAHTQVAYDGFSIEIPRRLI